MLHRRARITNTRDLGLASGPWTFQLAPSSKARAILRWLAVSAATAVAGCTILTSETPEQFLGDGRQPVGVFYSLPRSVIDLKLSVVRERAEFSLEIGPPRSVADPMHRYVLRYRPMPNYNDDVDITVGDRTFLRTVSATTEDKTTDIIVSFFELFGRLSGAFEAGEAPAVAEVIASQTVDPTNGNELGKALRKLNSTLKTYAGRQYEDCKSGVLKEAKYRDKTACDMYKRFKGASAPVQLWIEPAPITAQHSHYASHAHPDARPSHAPRVWPTADCTVGICYRPPLPYHIGYWVSAEPSDRSGIKHMYVFLPNEAPLVEIDIRRIFFGQKIQKITFSDEGFLAQVYVKKDSELLGLSKLPVSIIQAIITTLQFRATVLQDQTNEATDLKGLIDARRELAKQRSLLEAALVQAQAQQNRATSVSLIPPAPPASSIAEPQISQTVRP